MRRTAAALPDKELTHCRANLKVAAAAAAFASQPWLACLVCLGPLGHGCKRVGSKEPGQGGQAEWLLLLGLLLGLAPPKEEHAQGVQRFRAQVRVNPRQNLFHPLSRSGVALHVPPRLASLCSADQQTERRSAVPRGFRQMLLQVVPSPRAIKTT